VRSLHLPAAMRGLRGALLALFLIGAAVRVVDVGHPVDGSVGDPWREGDVAGIARNFYREGMDIAHPRIDWRGDGPGYVEMEFPIYPWTVAVLYRVFGYHEVIARVLSYVFGLLTLAVFFRLCASLLPPYAAVAASAFLVLSPLPVRLATAVQPDGLMLLFYVSSVYALVRWLEEDSWLYYVAALTATALAVLAKANAAHVGLLFVALIVHRRGWRAFADPRIWLLGIGSILPAVVWYAHARGFWLTYGNSLGLSSEYHWIGWDLIRSKAFLPKLLGLEALYVWTPPGLVLAGLAVFDRPVAPAARLGIFWALAVAVYLLIAGRTTSESWALHYHAVAVFPAALLLGCGVGTLIEYTDRRRASGALAIGYGLTGALLAGAAMAVRGSPLGSSVGWAALALGGVAAALALVVVRDSPRWRPGSVKSPRSLWGDLALGSLAVFPVLALQVAQLRGEFKHADWTGISMCASRFAAHIPDRDLIAVVGGSCFGVTGRPVSYQTPYMFFWTDRKGFSICMEQQSVMVVDSLRTRGARYLFVPSSAREARPGFEAALRAAYHERSSCGEWSMFELDVSPPPSSAARGQ